MGQYTYPAADPTTSSIRHPEKWIQIEPEPQGVRATCIACGGHRTFPTIGTLEVFLDEIIDAMTDHVLRNHAA